MAKRSLESIMAAQPDVDRARLAATTEEEIRQQAVEDGTDVDRDFDGFIMVPTVADLRRKLDMTQTAFAHFLRVPIGTVRNWEQGRTPPDPAARTLLALIAADAENARRILSPVEEQQGQAFWQQMVTSAANNTENARYRAAMFIKETA